MIEAYKRGIPEPMAHWFPTVPRWPKSTGRPRSASSFPTNTVPNALYDIDFMVKDSKRFADSGGWGYAVFEFRVGHVAGRGRQLRFAPAAR
jgi:hypothetical protein